MSSAQPAASDKQQLDQLLHVSTAIFHQALELVNATLKKDEDLFYTSQYLPGSTIGKHLRHARDYFMAVLDGAEASPHVFSYDTRKRNTPMERSLASAREALEEVIARLEAIVPQTGLNTMFTLNAITPFSQTVQTTFGRELWFAALHAVHHWAMIRVITGELGYKIEDDSFGFAPSTLVHQGTGGPLGAQKAKI